MSEYVFKLPDLGEGTVDAEIIEWHVAPGDVVREDDVIVDVMTDKANIEVPAPVSGTVVRVNGEPGDKIAVGSELIVFETDSARAASPAMESSSAARPKTQAEDQVELKSNDRPRVNAEVSAEDQAEDKTGIAETAAAAPDEAPAATPTAASIPAAARPEQEPTAVDHGKVIASPAIRRRAKEAGIDLAGLQGSGPRGRILRKDLEAALGSAETAIEAPPAGSPVEEHKVIGVRRVIAERLSESKRNIPHFAYVEEVDVTALEALRQDLNGRHAGARLTVLPFIALALVRAVSEHPAVNSRYDEGHGTLQRFRDVNLGIATQTPDGLKVPVVAQANRLSIWQLAEAISTMAEKARDNRASRTELTGSTITLTSLGKLGGIVSTPVINAPELAIVGVNKAVERPMVVDGQIAIRLMMNLSSSFDHRFIDGYDAAAFIQTMKEYLEQPARLFIPAPPG